MKNKTLVYLKLLILIFFLLLIIQKKKNSFARTQAEDLSVATENVFNKYLNATEYIPGGVISIVNNDSIDFCKGYGYADVENKKPFDPQKTIVQIASVTKLITTTAVLQLIERGNIDPEKPVSEYLGENFIRNPFEKPVLVKYLLTHTAGFDDRVTLMEASSSEEIIPLEIYNQKYLPQIVWEPGSFFNYSNYSFNLLAYLVQKVSGQKFEDYVSENILIPLEMNNSGFGYSTFLTVNLMKRYKLKANDNEELWLQEQPLLFTNIPGADDFKTTAHDMANFMIMYLNKGIFKDRQILKESTISISFETHFTYDESMIFQQGLGWRIMIRDGFRILYHYGDGTGIESSLVLFPDKHTGIFTAFNNQIGYDAKKEILDSVFNVLYKNEISDKLPEYKAYTPVEELTGNFFYMNDGQNTFEKIAFLIGDKTVSVDSNGDTILLNGKKYLESKPLLFDQLGDNANLIFIRDRSGKINNFSFGTSAYQRLPFLKDPALHRLILLICIIVILISFLFGVIKIISKKLRGINNLKETTYIWIHINELMILLFLIFMIITMDNSKIGGEVPDLLKIALTFPLLSILLLPVSIYRYIMLQKNKNYSVIIKTLIALSLASIITFLLILNEYNFIGYNFY